jgi:uncharacterized protein YcaQ
MYVPKAKREYGYYVLPILRGDQIVGRIEPAFDRKTRVLRIKGTWWQPDAPRNVALEGAVADLARWLGAEHVTWP